MEIIPKDLGVAKADPQPDKRVVLSFTNDQRAYRMSGFEAVQLGQRLLEVGREVGA